MEITKRALARIISMASGAVIALGGLAAVNHNRAVIAERAVENGYMRSIEGAVAESRQHKEQSRKRGYTLPDRRHARQYLGKSFAAMPQPQKARFRLWPIEELDLECGRTAFCHRLGKLCQNPLAEKCEQGAKRLFPTREERKILG